MNSWAVVNAAGGTVELELINDHFICTAPFQNSRYTVLHEEEERKLYRTKSVPDDDSESFTVQLLRFIHTVYLFAALSLSYITHTLPAHPSGAIWVHCLAQGHFSRQTGVTGIAPLTFWSVDTAETQAIAKKYNAVKFRAFRGVSIRALSETWRRRNEMSTYRFPEPESVVYQPNNPVVHYCKKDFTNLQKVKAWSWLHLAGTWRVVLVSALFTCGRPVTVTQHRRSRLAESSFTWELENWSTFTM